MQIDFDCTYDSEIESLCGIRELYNLPCENCINYEDFACPKLKKHRVCVDTIFEFNGQVKTLAEWAKVFNIKTRNVVDRYRRGARDITLFKGDGRWGKLPELKEFLKC